MAEENTMIAVEVAYALPDEQKIVSLNVHEGTTVHQAVVLSRISEYFPGIDPDNDPVGVFGKVIKDPCSTEVRAGDRIEIYRPLLADPKEIRARKAAEKAAKAQADA